MSYSFSVRAASKAELHRLVEAELDNVVVSQPIHAVDRARAKEAISAFINLLRDDDSMDVLVNVHGSVWAVEAGLNTASLGVTAILAARPDSL